MEEICSVQSHSLYDGSGEIIADLSCRFNLLNNREKDLLNTLEQYGVEPGEGRNLSLTEKLNEIENPNQLIEKNNGLYKEEDENGQILLTNYTDELLVGAVVTYSDYNLENNISIYTKNTGEENWVLTLDNQKVSTTINRIVAEDLNGDDLLDVSLVYKSAGGYPPTDIYIRQNKSAESSNPDANIEFKKALQRVSSPYYKDDFLHTYNTSGAGCYITYEKYKWNGADFIKIQQTEAECTNNENIDNPLEELRVRNAYLSRENIEWVEEDEQIMSNEELTNSIITERK